MLLWRLIEKDGTQSEIAFSIARPPEPELSVPSRPPTDLHPGEPRIEPLPKTKEPPPPPKQDQPPEWGKPAANGRECLKLISPERPVIAGYASVAVETQLSQAKAAALAKPATALFPLREPPRRYGGDRRAAMKRRNPGGGNRGFASGRSGQGKTRYTVLTRKRHGHRCGSASAPCGVAISTTRTGGAERCASATSDENRDRLSQPRNRWDLRMWVLGSWGSLPWYLACL
jgi:hypothetical protein